MTVLEFVLGASVVLAAAVAVVLLSHRLRLPPVAGLLLTGVLIGPTGLGLIREMEAVELFAEIGVVFLLFSIGLEFSLERLRELSRPFFVGGGWQSLLTLGVTAGVALALGMRLQLALFAGFLVVLSSTAIVLKLYGDRRETTAPQGKVITGILLFQDFLIVPMIVLTPILAGAAAATPGAILLRLTLSLAAVIGVFLTARYLMPPLLAAMVRTRVRELIVLGAVFACLGMAGFTAILGFSLALGAFLAGIIVSESEYSHQIVADVGPLRDLFTSVFFVSIGMLVDLPFVATNLPRLLAMAGGIVLLKALTGGAAAALLRFPARIITIVGLSLAQIGEFSFVLLEVGREHGLAEGAFYQSFIAVAVLTMLVTPALVSLGPRLAARWPALGGLAPTDAAVVPERGRHVILVGFGPAGRTLARVLRRAHVSYVVIELNGDTVQRMRREGEPILFGDSTRREILLHAGIETAGALVFVVSDVEAVKRSIRLARELNPALHIIVRTRMESQIAELATHGADEVVAEEFETSIEILTRLLRFYHIPRNVITAETRLLRGEGYHMLREPRTDPAVAATLAQVLAAGTTDLFQILPDSSLVGCSIRRLELRQRAGVTVIAVVRGEQAHTNPDADLTLEANDVLVLVGSHAEIEQAFAYLQVSPPTAS